MAQALGTLLGIVGYVRILSISKESGEQSEHVCCHVVGVAQSRGLEAGWCSQDTSSREETPETTNG